MLPSLRGEESNPYSLNQNQASYRLNDPGWTSFKVSDSAGEVPEARARLARGPGSTGSLPGAMGSLIKKRRKRMRKKKHKKMLRRTRHQRRK